jgi:hypothetical protein
MKDKFCPPFIKALGLIASLEDDFLELRSPLRQVTKLNHNHFKKFYSMQQLGRRKAFYLVSIANALGGKTISSKRLIRIGWTKLAALAPHITDYNLEDALLFAELNTVRNIEAVGHLEKPGHLSGGVIPLASWRGGFVDGSRAGIVRS